MSSYKLREEIVAAALQRHYAQQQQDQQAVDIADSNIASAAQRLAATLPASWRPGDRSPQQTQSR